MSDFYRTLLDILTITNFFLICVAIWLLLQLGTATKDALEAIIERLKRNPHA